METRECPRTRWRAAAAVTLLLAVLAAYADILFSSRPLIGSASTADMSIQYAFWRDFGFRELGAGNFALWNPHIFCGAPYFGGFQSGLLYPLNFVFLILPLAKAMNVSIMMHLWLGGMLVYFWTERRGLHPLACTFGGMLFMFCGQNFLHVYAGHMCGINAMAWAPLVFLAIDGCFETGGGGWILAGMCAVTMQLLGGDPQYFIYTAVTAGMYAAILLVRTPRRLRACAGLALMYAGAAGLAAAQVLTGLQVTGESVRSGGVSYEFATQFSFPPENAITLISSGFFGNMGSFPYWGRGYLWEMQLFFSVTGFMMACVGVARGERVKRRFAVTMAIILFILALGYYTPFFRLLYDYVPFFNRFRGISKFAFQMTLFLIMLSAIGMDWIIRNPNARRKVGAIALAGAAVLAVSGAFLLNPAAHAPGTLWGRIFPALAKDWEFYLDRRMLVAPGFARDAAINSSKNLFLAAAALGCAGTLLAARRLSSRAPYLLAILATGEMLCFAHTYRGTMEFGKDWKTDLAAFREKHPGDYRVLNAVSSNAGMSAGMNDIWGYAPLFSRRYAEFLYWTQGADPDKAAQYLPFNGSNLLFFMLRGKYLLSWPPRGFTVDEGPDPMEHVQLIRKCRVISGRNAIFNAMGDPSFDPRQEVILESEPDPAPAPGGADDSVRLVDSSTDRLTIEANLSAPAILLVTDAYYSGWRVRPLIESPQPRYAVLPANYVLRAIPLAAGRHLFRLEYSPTAFRLGVGVSLCSLVLLSATVIGCGISARRKRSGLVSPPCQ